MDYNHRDAVGWVGGEELSRKGRRQSFLSHIFQIENIHSHFPVVVHRISPTRTIDKWNVEVANAWLYFREIFTDHTVIKEKLS